MCWIQNDPVVNETKESKTVKSNKVQGKSGGKADPDASDAVEVDIVGSKDKRIHAELNKDITSEEMKDEKFDEYSQKENRSSNTLLDISFKIKKGTGVCLLFYNIFEFIL